MPGRSTVIIALVAFSSGLTVLIALALGALTKASRPVEQLERRLAAYQVTPPPSAPSEKNGTTVTKHPDQPSPARHDLRRLAVNLAERIVAQRCLDEAMAGRLEAADVPMRTAEWMLLHVATGVGGGLLLLLLGTGRLAPTVLGLALGLTGPWIFLIVRQGRREHAFLTHLPDTLQLLAGSLKAGYSLPQAIDTVVRQGEPPVAVEFHRALVENRLGIPMEDALERVASRLRSDDFSWVVMAIRIQRDVGGNLAELLITVADTLRERERLRRQVQVLSAEGRLSGIILGVLPVVFGAYLLLTRPEYLRPMTTPLGVVMLVSAVVLLAVGGLWVAKIVRVEV